MPGSARIAAFDFDKTLHFGGSAWRLTSAHVPALFKQLHEEHGYKIVIFSNQHLKLRRQSPPAGPSAKVGILDIFEPIF